MAHPLPPKPARATAARRAIPAAAATAAVAPACRGGSASAESADASPPYLRTEAARSEYTSFVWPIRDVAELHRLMRCQHIAPTDFVGFEFSGAVRQARERLGCVAISVDRRECEVGGMHACLEVQDAVAVARWSAAYFFPSCFQQLRADEDCLPLKINDGRAFWGCLQFVWWVHAPANMVVV